MCRWTCSNCGKMDNKGIFCIKCGSKRPENTPVAHQKYVSSQETTKPNWFVFFFLFCLCTPIVALVYAFLTFSFRKPLPSTQISRSRPSLAVDEERLAVDEERANAARKKAIKAMNERAWDIVILHTYEAIQQKLGVIMPDDSIAEAAGKIYGWNSTLAIDLASFTRFKKYIERSGKSATEEMANSAFELMEQVFNNS